VGGSYVHTSVEVVAKSDTCHLLVDPAKKLMLHHGNGGPGD